MRFARKRVLARARDTASWDIRVQLRDGMGQSNKNGLLQTGAMAALLVVLSAEREEIWSELQKLR